MTSPKKGSSRHLALAAMFAALALIFSYVEVLVPIPVPIPGVKLGLANLVILIALYRLGFRLAFSINCVRIVIAGETGVHFKIIYAGLSWNMHAAEYDDRMNFIQRIELPAESRKKGLLFFIFAV